MFKKIKMAVLISLAASTIQAIEIKSLSQAVDVAGKQRMFTQRMLKDYAMWGMHNNFDNPKEDLKKTSDAFEDHMQSLNHFNKDPATANSIKEAMKLWKPIKSVLSKNPAKDKVKKLQIDLDALLKVANDTTVLFAKQTGKKSGEIINISGRQRMLSQRMASLYMLKAWSIEDPMFKDKMNKAMKLYKSSQYKLLSYDKNTDKIKLLLNKAKKAFAYFEYLENNNTFAPALIYKKSMEILKNMNTVTGLYVKISK